LALLNYNVGLGNSAGSVATGDCCLQFLVHLLNVEYRLNARLIRSSNPQIKSVNLLCESTNGLLPCCPPLPFIITQPKSWYLFYHLM